MCNRLQKSNEFFPFLVYHKKNTKKEWHYVEFKAFIERIL